MGRVVRFRRRRWTKPAHYGHRDPNALTVRVLVRDTWWWLGVLRPFILLGLVGVAWVNLDPRLVEPPAVLTRAPQSVTGNFTRCGLGRGYYCVIDGDTFKLGSRSVRMIGIDAPETHPSRCAEEARLGELATQRLQALLNQGPFEMVAPLYRATDFYGRDLRVIRRMRPDGTVQSIADDMRASGLARRYLGGLRGGWC